MQDLYSEEDFKEAWHRQLEIQEATLSHRGARSKMACLVPSTSPLDRRGVGINMLE
jgi:hypothetical protein